MAQQELNDLTQASRDALATLDKLAGIHGPAQQKQILATLDAATGIENFGAKLNVATTAVVGLSKIAGEYYQAMYQGKKGYAAMSSTIDTAADAITALGVALLALSGPLGLLVGGIGLAVKAASKYVKASAEQSDKLYDAYRDMSRVGAAGSEGLQGVYSDMQKLGLGVQDLDKMVKLMTENAHDLSLLGGSVGAGRQKFALAAEATDQYRVSLMRLGMSQDAINDGMMSYIRLNSKMGDTQRMSFQQLAESAHNYILERDALAKVTGLTLKEQEKALEAVRSQELFRSKLEELRAQGKYNQANELENAYLAIYSVNKTAAQGFADLSTGNLRSEAAQKEMRVSQGQTLEAINRITDGQLRGAEAADMVSQAHVDVANAMGVGLAKTGNYNRVMGDYAGDMDMRAKLQAGGFKQAEIEALRQQNLQQAGTDKEVARQADLINNQRLTMNAVQDFVRAGVGPATKVVKGFNDALGGIARRVLPGKGAGAAPAGYAAPATAPTTSAPAAAPTTTAPARAAPATGAGAGAGAGSTSTTATAPTPTSKYAPITAPPSVTSRPSTGPEGYGLRPGEVYTEDAKYLVERLQKYGITNQYALSAIVATAQKESGLNAGKQESGASAYIATLAKRGLGYIYKVFPQLGPGGRVARAMGYEGGVPENVIQAEWSKGDQSFFSMVYGGLGTNKSSEDGYRYRGRGYIQITGRDVYDRVGKEVGIDLLTDPDAITRDKNVAVAALAGYLFMTRGGKDSALKDLNSFQSQDEALKYVLRTVAGLGHKESEFGREGSHLAEQYRKSSAYLASASQAVADSKVVTAAEGGLFKGPKSGYPATLHGEELVAPLDKSSDFMIALERMNSVGAMILETAQRISLLQKNNTAVDQTILKYTVS